MRDLTPHELAATNLAYREPALYDELLTDDTVVDEVLDVVDRAGVEVATVLDLGCGTGRVLDELGARRGWAGTGVDLQPGLLAYAGEVRPGLEMCVGDVRDLRLGRVFDLVLCVGNTLSYLLTEPELAAAFDTMAAHSRPGTLLAIATLDTPGTDRHGTARVESAVLGAVEVETVSRWDPAAGLVTSRRSWRWPDGRTEEDHVTRRVWPRRTLEGHGVRAGFSVAAARPGTGLSLCASRTRRDGPSARRGCGLHPRAT